MIDRLRLYCPGCYEALWRLYLDWDGDTVDIVFVCNGCGDEFNYVLKDITDLQAILTDIALGEGYKT